MSVEPVTIGPWRFVLCRSCREKAIDDWEFQNAVKTVPNPAAKTAGELPHLTRKRVS